MSIVTLRKMFLLDMTLTNDLLIILLSNFTA